MRFLPTQLKDLILVVPEVLRDTRGFFMETFHSKRYVEGGIPGPFVQDNHSRSAQGVLRGLHGQWKHPQGKLLRVIAGAIFDAVVDARPDSPTYRQWAGWTLSSDNLQQIYVPPGFLHGFCVLSPFAEVEYKCTDYYHPGDEIGVLWNDPALGIEWPIKDPQLSDKDKKLPLFESNETKFESYRSLGHWKQ